jgi:cellulose synthase/poly-beta-1,6-N-acetylglucosamine synthase-like glycosyltransferase
MKSLHPLAALGPADTWTNLPQVTLPLPALALDPSASFARASIAGASFAGASFAGASIAGQWRVRGRLRSDEVESARWAWWGAARAGARTSLTRSQALGLGLLALLVLVLLLLDTHQVLVEIIGGLTWLYLAAGAHKVWLLVRGERALQAAQMAPAEQAAVADPDGGDGTGDDTEYDADNALPLYTILVPLHREGQMLPTLLQRLAALEYPRERLEILLLVEADDEETRAALEACELPAYIRPLRVPPGLPRTKPRALNVGLARARGEYIVVYDAEDCPEPDQLRIAVAAFRALSRRTVCLQARLNFYNARQTLLTRLFAIDYTMWYELLLPGLTRLRGFVPLGGTSNHFRIEALRRLGGWDPYNVTEDCDLGARIAGAGLQVGMIDSVTWEEAVTRVGPWIRQRSRWVKGYIQTYLVHMRRPVRLWREVGPIGFLDFQLLVGGSSLALLINPLMWLLTLTYALGHGTPLAGMIESLFPTAVYYPALACLVIGNFIFFYSNLYACIRSGQVGLTRYALLSPLYWLLMSVGAWVGLLSLVRNPFYWAKTEHGVSLAGAARLPESARRVTGGPALSIVIPAYNEEHRLPYSLARLRAYVHQRQVSCEVIVVDDGSTDATRDLVRDWMGRWPELRLVEGEHRGKGGAVRAGVIAARGAYVALADADFSMPVEEFERFSVSALGPYDIAIGSREARGAVRYDEPRYRKLMSRVFNLLVRLVLLRGVRDTQCGFKFLRREVALDLCLDQTIDGWGFDMELLFIARRRGYTVREVPITWRYATGSRVRPVRATLALLRDLAAIRLNSWRGRYARPLVDPLQSPAYERRPVARAVGAAAPAE